MKPAACGGMERLMEQPIRRDGASPKRPEQGPLPPHLLSRDYEDHLDWLENQRRDRTRRGRGRRLGLGLFAAVVTAFSLAGTMLRRR